MRLQTPENLNTSAQPIKNARIYYVVLALMVTLLGASGALGIYVFIYAKGGSYLSNEPAACANCHVMKEVLNDWQSAEHHHVAVCNDCHVPAHPVAKWVVKAINGMHHGYAFTFQETPVTIRAGSLSSAIVQRNCERCHEGILPSHAYNARGNYNIFDSNIIRCVGCHQQVGHSH